MCDECEEKCNCPCVFTHEEIDVGIVLIKSGPDGCDYCMHLRKQKYE